MASEQVMSETITRAVAEANRIAIKTMVERTHDRLGPKVGSPTMKQPIFNWNAQDKYSELKHSD